MEKWLGMIKHIQKNVTSRTEFMNARRDAEEKARCLLRRKAGAFTREDLVTFLDHCNTERVPRDGHCGEFPEQDQKHRFVHSFVGQNRNLMVGALDACNQRIAYLWQPAGDAMYALDRFWEEPQVKGAGTGLPTMLMYLREPETFSVWLPFLAKALGILTGREFPISRRHRSVDNYRRYNDAVNECLRRPFRLEPQEIDYILSKIGKKAKARSGA